LDIEEDRNRNGFLDLELNETNPKDPDTDKDGAMDGEDYSPLDPNVWKKPTSDMISGFVVWFIIILIIILLLVVAFIFILKQRTDREKTKVKMDLRRTKRNLRRFEVLTGVPTNDLPAIEAVQWALPGVIAEASEFILEAPPTDDLLPPSQEDDGKAPEPEMKVSRPEIQDMEAPIVPTITEKPSGPEPPKAAAKQGGKVISCSLCGSEVPVAEGATSVECPLCGELIKV
jgi:cbb3-type cytochrome oxidase subunit 3